MRLPVQGIVHATVSCIEAHSTRVLFEQALLALAGPDNAPTAADGYSARKRCDQLHDFVEQFDAIAADRAEPGESVSSGTALKRALVVTLLCDSAQLHHCVSSLR